jgi:hypothetical protein
VRDREKRKNIKRERVKEMEIKRERREKQERESGFENMN